MNRRNKERERWDGVSEREEHKENLVREGKLSVGMEQWQREKGKHEEEGGEREWVKGMWSDVEEKGEGEASAQGRQREVKVLPSVC